MALQPLKEETLYLNRKRPREREREAGAGLGCGGGRQRRRGFGEAEKSTCGEWRLKKSQPFSIIITVVKVDAVADG